MADRINRLMKLTVGLALILGTREALAQIQVEVNQRPVTFGDVGAVRQEGRVLIPLRAVGQELGATIRWNAALRTVFGEKGARRFELPMGTRQAVVDGRPVTLDVPAQMIRGTTMVPLRFVAEALGADVTWDGAKSRVVVSAAGTPASGSEVRVSSFRHDAAGPLIAGSPVTVTLFGTPGGQATFDVGSIARDLPLSEDRAEPGRYVGRYVIPTGLTEREVPVVARLRVGGASAPLIQAGTPLVIDSRPPAVTNAEPAEGAVVSTSRPNIYAEFGDPGGTGLLVESVRMRVNGVDVTPEARVTPTFVIYTPEGLPEGTVSVSVEAKDRAGNALQKAWKFSVARNKTAIEPTLISPGPDDPITSPVVVKGRGEPGAKVLVEVTYTALAFGVLSVNGTAAKQEVTVGADGTFKTPPMTLKLQRGAKQVEYAIKLASADAEGQ